MRIKHSIFTLVFLLIINAQTACVQHQKEEPKGKEFIIHSETLNEDRTCLVSLPEGYMEPSMAAHEYPLVILLDGEVFFKTASGIMHFMSSDRNRNHMMPASIIVAIDNVDRERDFTHTKIKTKRINTMGGGSDFLKFLEKELIPYIDEHYRTAPYRTLVGHSLGGLFAVNAYMDKNSIFDAYLSIDPSIWWDEAMMKRKVDAVSGVSLNKKLYIATANQGFRNNGKNKKRHEALVALLENKSGEGGNIRLEYFENEDHRSVPLIAIYTGFKYLYREQEE